MSSTVVSLVLDNDDYDLCQLPTQAQESEVKVLGGSLQP